MRLFVRLVAPAALFLSGLAFVSHSQTPPAPTVDRVLFPADYQSWQVLYTFDRADTKHIVIVYDNDLAASVVRGGEYDYPRVRFSLRKPGRPSRTRRVTPSVIPTAA